jgi:hypothetical protein
MPRAEVETVALFLRAARSAMHINSAARSAIHINDRQAALSAIEAAASIVDRALAVAEPSEQAPAPAPTAAVLQLPAPAEPAEPAERSGRQLVGTRVRVWWEEEETWFSGSVDYYNEARGKHRVRYDDGDRRTYDLFGEGAIHSATTLLHTSFLSHTHPCRSASDRPVWQLLNDERARTSTKLPSSPPPRRRTEATREGVAATMYSDLLLRALASGPLARGPLLQSAARLGCVKDEHLHRLEECLDSGELRTP